MTDPAPAAAPGSWAGGFARLWESLLPATPGATLVRRASDGASVDITPRSVEALTVVAACS